MSASALLRAAAVVALALPQGGCLFFLFGYEMGRWAGNNEARHLEWSEPENRTWEAIEARNPVARAAAITRLETIWAAPPTNKSRAPAEIERRIPRIAEALDDPDARVRDAARSFLRLAAGKEVLITPGDLATLNGPASTERDEAEGRATSAALRVYALARLGVDQRKAVPLLHRGLTYEGFDANNPGGAGVRGGASRGVGVSCALALHAITGEAELVLPVLRAGLKDYDDQVAIAAAIGLGRLGPAARPALDDLVEAEGFGIAALRRAAERARARILGAS